MPRTPWLHRRSLERGGDQAATAVRARRCGDPQIDPQTAPRRRNRATVNSPERRRRTGLHGAPPVLAQSSSPRLARRVIRCQPATAAGPPGAPVQASTKALDRAASGRHDLRFRIPAASSSILVAPLSPRPYNGTALDRLIRRGSNETYPRNWTFCRYDRGAAHACFERRNFAGGCCGAQPAAPGERHNEDRRAAALVWHQRHHLCRAGAHVE